MVSLFAIHKSSFRKEACNLKTKSPKESSNFKITNSLLAVTRKYGQNFFELRKSYLDFTQKNHSLNNLDIKTFIYLFIYFIYLYIYPPDTQESDRGPDTYEKQLPRPASRDAKILLRCPVETFILDFYFYRDMTETQSCLHRPPSSIKGLSRGHNRMARIGFEPRAY